MGIFNGRTTGLVNVGTGDTPLTQSAGTESREIYSGIFHNTGAATSVVDLFLSDDAVSTIGERIDRITLDPGRTHLMRSMVVPAGHTLLAKADVTGCNFLGTYTARTGGDA